MMHLFYQGMEQGGLEEGKGFTPYASPLECKDVGNLRVSSRSKNSQSVGNWDGPFPSRSDRPEFRRVSTQGSPKTRAGLGAQNATSPSIPTNMEQRT